MPKKSLMPKILKGGYAKLDEMIRQEKNARVKDRLRIIRWKFERKLNTEIASLLSIQEKTVNKWVKRWNKEGYKGLLDKPKKGRNTILTKEEENSVMQEVEQEKEAKRVTCKQVVARIKENFNKKMSSERVRTLLHKHKMSFKKPEGVDYRRDEEKRAEFIVFF